MKVIILSTDTDHHRYFISSINRVFPLQALFFEKNSHGEWKSSFIREVRRAKKLYGKLYSIFFSPYWQLPLWDRQEGLFEKRQFFKDIPRELPVGIPLKIIRSINDREALLEIKQYNPDIIILFGVTKAEKPLLEIPRIGVLNIHRGMVPYYRGLDSALWAIYFEDFQNIGVTIHFVDAGLDTGDIVFQERVKFSPSDKIYHLRYITTVLATELMLKTLKKIEEEDFKVIPQVNNGRYFSYMPCLLKFKIIYKYNHYITGLKSGCIDDILAAK